MKQISKLASMLVLLVAGVTGVTAQNPFDVNTRVTGVATAGTITDKQSTGSVGLVFKYGQLHYKILSDKTVEVTNEVKSVCRGRVEIPNIVKHNNKSYTVVGIGNSAFSQQKNLTEIVIPKTVRYIDKYAFGFTGLTEVVIPGDNVSLKRHAFINCEKLKVVTLSGRNPSFSDRSFDLCMNMQELRIRDLNSKNKDIKLVRTPAVIKVIR